MRRQVKPFVTEYRGAVRRHKDQTGSADQPQEAPATRPRPTSEAQRVFGSDVQDTSYEAALRAADALFATPAERKAMSPVTQPKSSQPDPWVKPATRTSPLVESEAQPLGDTTEARGPAVDDDKGAASHGRILQAIEPPEEDRFAVLEAERAPKRRGRKPGSKNKPKPSIVDDWAVTTRETVQHAGAKVPEPSLDDDGSMLDRPSDDDVRPLCAVDEAAPKTDLPAIGDLPAAAGRARNDRFGWKRTGLRPGERWKRRLPKTAW